MTKAEEKAADLKRQVSDYEGILRRYSEKERGGGRWYYLGKQRLDELREELRQAEDNCPCDGIGIRA